ncbi:MAG TPA: hypothetical protein PK800_04015, partial [Syntrophorhabdaceae bacterium]|nr:hypothetical protein [Syntrophorhabdaceae bacterium]
MDTTNISGIRKAAILLLTMDEQLSKEILKDFEKEEIEAIGKEVAKLKFIPESVVKQVHEEFLSNIRKVGQVIVDGQTRFKTLVKKSLGDETAETYLQAIESSGGTPGDFVKTCDPRLLATNIKGEHPQTIALIVSLLPPKKACEVISALPENVQGEVMTRMANLGRVDKKLLLEIEDIIREQLQDIGGGEERQMGGVGAVASILNQMDKKREAELLGSIEEANPE